MSQEANKVMTLILPNERRFSVIFNRTNGNPIEAEQVFPFA